MKIQIDKNKPQPNIRQYSLNAEVIEGIRHIIKEYLNQDLIIPWMIPCSTPILPVKKSYGRAWGFVQDPNNIIIPQHPVILILNLTLSHTIKK